MSDDLARGMEGSPATDHILSVVIPAYNEQDGIAAIIERVLGVRPALTAQGISLELLVVDDGSGDGTAAIVKRYPEARLVQHPHNRGYGAALKTGFSAACGDWLGFMDADGTYPPEDFPRLCAALESGAGADLVVGSRRSGADTEMPLVRRIGNRLWSDLVTLLGNQRVLDPASGMRVLRREALERLYPLPDGLNLTPVMSTRAIHEGVRMLEVPIPYTERQGRSKLNVVNDGMRFLGTIVWTVLTYNPARLLGGVGVGIFGVGVLAALGLAIARLAGVTALGPWGVVVAFVAGLAPVIGFDLFALGATFNYLVSLFHNEPVRQGLFGKPIFDPPLDRHFWWMGLSSGLAGLAVGIVSIALGVSGWSLERLWLYLLGGAVLVMLGMNLLVFWLIMRVLEELSRRPADVQADLACVP
ncbi:MAG: glycosyltransferase family 2 protein [Anaerolineae bacterium]